jgi:hypothetical protein
MEEYYPHASEFGNAVTQGDAAHFGRKSGGLRHPVATLRACCGAWLPIRRGGAS